MSTQPSRWKRQNDTVDERLDQQVETIMALYDWTGIDEVKRQNVRTYISLELCQWATPTWSVTQQSMKEAVTVIALNTYDVLGLLPMSMREEMPHWLEYACKWGHDNLALRLLNDGVDPSAHAPRCWSAATRIRRNREAMPKSWAWLCRRELSKTAAKARKRSWASGVLVEPRAL